MADKLHGALSALAEASGHEMREAYCHADGIDTRAGLLRAAADSLAAYADALAADCEGSATGYAEAAAVSHEQGDETAARGDWLSQVDSTAHATAARIIRDAINKALWDASACLNIAESAAHGSHGEGIGEKAAEHWLGHLSSIEREGA